MPDFCNALLITYLSPSIISTVLADCRQLFYWVILSLNKVENHVGLPVRVGGCGGGRAVV